jgi:hypothetical protein
METEMKFCATSTCFRFSMEAFEIAPTLLIRKGMLLLWCWLTSIRPRQYVPKNPYATPAFYPNAPLLSFDTPAVFEKFDIDTLFFIFYYQQDTRQQ